MVPTLPGTMHSPAPGLASVAQSTGAFSAVTSSRRAHTVQHIRASIHPLGEFGDKLMRMILSPRLALSLQPANREIHRDAGVKPDRPGPSLPRIEFSNIRQSAAKLREPLG